MAALQHVVDTRGWAIYDGSGKSAAALEVAERLGGVIVNTDSMQGYSILDVLTARPGAADLAQERDGRAAGHLDPDSDQLHLDHRTHPTAVLPRADRWFAFRCRRRGAGRRSGPGRRRRAR